MIVAGEADRVLASAVESGAIPGAVAMAVDARGTLYEGAFGAGARGGDAPMALDSLFSIASMTKPITAVAAMQLVEQDRLVLDQPVGEVLPELAEVRVLEGFDEAGTPRFRAPRRSITLRHLLTHTAGFAYTSWNADLLRFERLVGEAIRRTWPPTLVRDPGERWEYGTNVDWVGRVIEQVTDCSLEDYFQANVFGPLGMADTSFLMNDERRARLAARYQRDRSGALSLSRIDAPDRPAFFNGGGGLYSTGPDYARFLRMLLGDGELDGARVLRPETVAEIGRNHIGDLTVGVLPTTNVDRSNDAEFFPGLTKRWGLAGFVNAEPAPTGRGAGSWAWAGLYNTYFWTDPTRRVAGLLLTQILPFCDGPVLAAFDGFERAIYGLAGPSRS